MHIFQTQFLYVLFKEIERSTDEHGRTRSKTDTTLRIVYWPTISDPNDGHFVIYGLRPTSAITGEYTPYRVSCKDIASVVRFAKTVVSPENDVSVELHQFDALNDDSEDQFNVSWENNAENGSTEIVAFDFETQTKSNGIRFVPFKFTMRKLLRALKEAESV
jgi:hypothetical protein